MSTTDNNGTEVTPDLNDKHSAKLTVITPLDELAIKKRLKKQMGKSYYNYFDNNSGTPPSVDEVDIQTNSYIIDHMITKIPQVDISDLSNFALKVTKHLMFKLHMIGEFPDININDDFPQTLNIPHFIAKDIEIGDFKTIIEHTISRDYVYTPHLEIYYQAAMSFDPAIVSKARLGGPQVALKTETENRDTIHFRAWCHTLQEVFGEMLTSRHIAVANIFHTKLLNTKAVFKSTIYESSPLSNSDAGVLVDEKDSGIIVLFAAMNTMEKKGDTWDESNCIDNLTKYYIMLFGPSKKSDYSYTWENLILSIATKLPLPSLKSANKRKIFTQLSIQLACAKSQLSQIKFDPHTASPVTWVSNWLLLFHFIHGDVDFNPALSVAWYNSLQDIRKGSMKNSLKDKLDGILEPHNGEMIVMFEELVNVSSEWDDYLDPV